MIRSPAPALETPDREPPPASERPRPESAAPEAAGRGPRWSARGAWTRLDAALLAVLGALALAVRLPNYLLIPAFTDETAEILYGLLIARGENQPLSSGGAYKGSLWTWLVAALFGFGPDRLEAPRTFVLALGILTVLATYALGRAWGGRAGGTLAAALLATAGGHVAVNSHVAWGSSLTPLFTTLAAWTLWAGLRRVEGEAGRGTACRAWSGTAGEGTGTAGEGTGPACRAPTPSPTLLLVAGFCWGLAFQTHPLVLALLPGAALFLLMRRPGLLRTPWPYLAGGLFLLANFNLLVYNLASDFRSVAASLEHAQHYTGEDALTATRYLQRLGLLLLGLLQLLAGAIDARPRASAFLLDSAVWPPVLLALGGLAWQWRRGNPLPGLLLLGPLLIFPLFNDKFAPILSGRYLAPLLPILFAALAALLVEGFRRFNASGQTRLRPAALGLGLATAFLVLHPLLYLRTFYDQEQAAGRTNAAVFGALDQVRASRSADEAVTIVRPRRETHLGAGNGLASQVFSLALDLERVPFDVVDLGSLSLADPAGRCREQVLLYASRDADAQRDFLARLRSRGAADRPDLVARPGAYPVIPVDC